MNNDILIKTNSFMLDLAYRAGAMMMEGWVGPFTIRKKGPIDLVTNVDLAINHLITKEIHRAFPDHAICAEEDAIHNSTKHDQHYVWFVDPIDGTTNYAHRIPHAAVTMALYDQQLEQVIAGIIYDPFRKECFAAQRGKGAQLNGSSIQVSATQSLGEALLATGFSYDTRETKDNNLAESNHLLPLARDLRRMGAASLDLAWMAMGRFDAFWERQLKPWDYAAGVLIVEEAGGRVSQYDGSEFEIHCHHVAASNGLLHEEFLTELQKARKNAHLPALP